MKKLLSILIFWACSGAVHAQQTAQQTSIEFNGQRYPCYMIEYDLGDDLTEKTIKESMKEKGYKGDSKKGFLVFRDARVPEIDNNEPRDLFIRVERKSRTEKDKSVVYIIVAKPGEVPDDKVKKSGKEVTPMAFGTGGATMLATFQPDINYAAHVKIEGQMEDDVKTAEKKMDDLRDDEKKLEKKIKDLQEELEKNRKEQEKQVEEVKRAKELLEVKKSQRPAKPGKG